MNKINIYLCFIKTTFIHEGGRKSKRIPARKRYKILKKVERQNFLRVILGDNFK